MYALNRNGKNQKAQKTHNLEKEGIHQGRKEGSQDLQKVREADKSHSKG